MKWIKFRVDSDCSNLRLPSRSGSSGSVSFTDLAPGRYVLRVAATNSKEDRAIERRRFEISSDPSFCTTHLINGGVTVRGDTATVEFAEMGPVEMFRCRLDTEPAFVCKLLHAVLNTVDPRIFCFVCSPFHLRQLILYSRHQSC